MRAEIQLITPEMAQGYLDKNICNFRKMNSRTVNQYSADMKSCNWKFNGEAIKFNESGALVDGQHRLAAIVKSGMTIPMIVVTGISDKVRTFDIGRGRTTFEIARANGVSAGASNLAVIGAATLLLMMQNGNSAPKQKLVEVLQKEQEVWTEAFSVCSSGQKNAICRKSPIVLAAYCLLKRGYNMTDICSFFEVANTGFPVGDKECSPAIVIRNYITGIKYRNESHHPTGRLLLFSATLSAFYDFVDGRPRKKMYAVDAKNMELLAELNKAVTAE